MGQGSAGIFAAIALLAAAATAEAAAIPAPTLVGDFNVITQHDFSTTSDVDGNVLIGGDLSGSGILCVTTKCTIAPPTNFGNVNVFGNNSGHWAQSTQLIYVAGSNTGGFGSAKSPPSQFSGHVFANNFATDVWAPLTTLQTTFAGLTANSSFNPTTGVFSAAPVGNVAVWDLTTTELNDAKTNLSLSGLPSTDTGVVNVTCPTAGCNFTTNQTWSTLAALKNVVFDFENTANVFVDNQWETSIFALDSKVFNSAPIEGALVAESYVGSAELHDFPLSLCTPGTPGCFLNPPAAIPEPGSLAVLGSAIVAFVAVGRRRWW